MSRRPDKLKLAEWTERIKRWDAERDDISVPEFVEREGVTEASFYWWQRKIRRLWKEHRNRELKQAKASPAPRQPLRSPPEPHQAYEQRPTAVKGGAPSIVFRWPSGMSVEIPADQTDALSKMIDSVNRAELQQHEHAPGDGDDTQHSKK